MSIGGQRDPRWAGRKMLPGPRTLGEAGCLVCALAYPGNPLWLHQLLVENGAYTATSDLQWPRLVNFRLIRREDFTSRPFTPENREQLLREWRARSNRVAVLQVNFVPGAPFRQHWVRLLDEDFAAYDPWYGEVVDVVVQYAEPGRGLDYAVWGYALLEDVRVSAFGPARMGKEQFVRILAEAQSPATPAGEAIYEEMVRAGLRPEVALAFFEHESAFGTKGAAVRTHNWGNLRSAPVPELADEVKNGWAWFRPREGEREGYEWVRSAIAWARLLLEYRRHYRREYLDEILIRYAPSTDGNAPLRYADAVRARLQEWCGDGV